MANEQVRFDIKVELENALLQLRQIGEASENDAEAVKRLNTFLLKMSKETKVPLEQLRKTLKGINDELIRGTRTGGDIFGGFQGGGSAIFDAEKRYSDLIRSQGRFQTSQNGVVTSVNKGNKAWDEADRAARGYGHGIDVVRTALGTLLAVGIFQFLNIISEAFTKAVANAREFEETLFRLSNVERILSLEGVEITMKGLENGIKNLKKEFPIFSKEDIAQMVGSLATTTSELGYSEQQILDLARAILVLNVNSTETETVLQTQQKVTTALLSGTTKGVSSLGVQLNDTVIKTKAMEMGFLKAGESLENLTKREKDLVKLQIVLDRTGQLGENMNEFFGSNTAQIMENEAAWNDLLTTMGQVILPFVPAATTFFKTINDGLNGGKVILIEVITLISALTTAYAGAISGLGNFTDIFKRSVEEFREALVNEFFKEIPEGAPNWFMEGWGKHIKEQADTATGPLKDLGDAIDEFDAEGLKEKIEAIIEDTANAREDLAENLQRKLEDLDEEYRRKALDAEMDYRRKIEDINRDAERDIARIKERHREQDRRDEERYQLALWELRMRFLMDLEDALHARDARQVIRLQKQYNLDKEALRRKHELEGRQREDDQRNELEDIEHRRQERLEDAQIEYQQRLADQRLAKQRELDDLNVWYAREQADIELAQERKLQTLLKGWIDEQKITAENAAKVYEILRGYFGPGGLTDALYQYMMQSLVASTQNAVNAAMSAMGTVGGRNMSIPTSTGGTTSGRSGRTSGRGRAEGGTLIATRPTTVTLGEKGAEIATFKPINRIGRDEGKVDISGLVSGSKNTEGRISVDVTLSPDLRASVVEEAMDGVGEVIFRINGTKV